MRLALAQLERRLGDVGGNTRRLREVLVAALDGGADLVVFPELYLSAYALSQAKSDTSGPAAELIAVAEDAGDAALLLGFSRARRIADLQKRGVRRARLAPPRAPQAVSARIRGALSSPSWLCKTVRRCCSFRPASARRQA